MYACNMYALDLWRQYIIFKDWIKALDLKILFYAFTQNLTSTRSSSG